MLGRQARTNLGVGDHHGAVGWVEHQGAVGTAHVRDRQGGVRVLRDGHSVKHSVARAQGSPEVDAVDGNHLLPNGVRVPATEDTAVRTRKYETNRKQGLSSGQ